jgi:hypothetical protein
VSIEKGEIKRLSLLFRAPLLRITPLVVSTRRRIPVPMTFADRRKLTLAGKKKKRPGPKPAEFANVRHRARAVHKYWNPLHVTMRAKRGLPSFRAQTLFAAFDRAVRRTRRADFRIVEFSVQDDHLHLIVEADDGDALARGRFGDTTTARVRRKRRARCS